MINNVENFYFDKTAKFSFLVCTSLFATMYEMISMHGFLNEFKLIIMKQFNFWRVIEYIFLSETLNITHNSEIV